MAFSSSGYDWKSRQAHHGLDNPTMGEAYEREQSRCEQLRDKDMSKVHAEREQTIIDTVRKKKVAVKVRGVNN